MHSDPAWANAKDEELLKLRICDLGLRLEDTETGARALFLHEELSARGLRFKPKLYFGDEWFSPEGMLAISVPFYLAHPRLITLERKMMLEVEGGTPEHFQKLLRHEAGHCFDHGYGFSKSRKWRALFGSPDQEYSPDTYRPRPYSRSFVRHLENWYAQAHPDEDFAETFAVWLDPASDWRTEYRDWPVVLAKLEYVDELARETAEKEPLIDSSYLPCSAARMKTTLENYYSRRRKDQADQYPDFYDSDLKRLFPGSGDLAKREAGAAVYMRRNRKTIINSVSNWTGETKFTINALVRKLTKRCDELDLRLGSTEAQANLEVAAFLATLVTNYLFTGKFKRSV